MAIVVDEARSEHRRRSRRNDIVTAAIQVFARQGYADASIQEVAAEAGVAPTAVYYHFSGKEDLFDVALRADPGDDHHGGADRPGRTRSRPTPRASWR